MTAFSDGVSTALETADRVILKRLVRVATHLPAVGSLAYFGTISAASMMGPIGETNTLVAALTKYVGTTTNAEFALAFPTLITPASWVFLVWPLISLLQAVVLSVSALNPFFGGPPVLSQSDLASLSVANVAATAWLVLASRASTLPGSVAPLGCALVLPLVPLFAGYALRTPAYFASNRPTFGKVPFQVFSAFTTLATFLAWTVELQHGGSVVPFLFGRAEACAGVFLSLTALTVWMPRQGIVRKGVTVGALGGILAKRIGANLAAFGRCGTAKKLAMSPSFWGTAAVFVWALGRLFDKDDTYGDNV